MPEQIIAAELHRDAGGQIWAIKFDGVVYVPARRMPVPPEDPPPDTSWITMEPQGWPDPDRWPWRWLTRRSKGQ